MFTEDTEEMRNPQFHIIHLFQLFVIVSCGFGCYSLAQIPSGPTIAFVLVMIPGIPIAVLVGLWRHNRIIARFVLGIVFLAGWFFMSGYVALSIFAAQSHEINWHERFAGIDEDLAIGVTVLLAPCAIALIVLLYRSWSWSLNESSFRELAGGNQDHHAD